MQSDDTNGARGQCLESQSGPDAGDDQSQNGIQPQAFVWRGNQQQTDDWLEFAVEIVPGEQPEQGGGCQVLDLKWWESLDRLW